MYIPDNLDLFDAYEREEARRERYYRDPFNDEEEEEIENERITDNCKSATGKDNN